MRGWSQNNPDEALAWLTANPESPFGAGAVQGIVEGLSKRDLDRATQLVLGVDADSGEVAKMMEKLAESALQQRQLGGMVTWFDTLPDSDAKRQGLQHVYWRLQNADKERAMEWVGQTTDKPWRSDQIISELAGKVARENPQSALDWVAKLPPSPESGRYSGLRDSIIQFGKQDPAAAEEWLTASHPQEMKDQAVAAYTYHLLQTNSPDANRWLEKVADKRLMLPENVNGLPTDHSFAMSIGGHMVTFPPVKGSSQAAPK
jgi:hypothetical protein